MISRDFVNYLLYDDVTGWTDYVKNGYWLVTPRCSVVKMFLVFIALLKDVQGCERQFSPFAVR